MESSLHCYREMGDFFKQGKGDDGAVLTRLDGGIIFSKKQECCYDCVTYKVWRVWIQS